MVQEFSMEKFQTTSGLIFLLRWIWVLGKNRVLSIFPKCSALKLLTFIAVVGFAMVCAVKYKLST